MKKDTGTAINEKVEPLTISAWYTPGLNPPVFTKGLTAAPIAPRINPRIVPKIASPRSCIHTIAQSALPISSANDCADGLVTTFIYWLGNDWMACRIEHGA